MVEMEICIIACFSQQLVSLTALLTWQSHKTNVSSYLNKSINLVPAREVVGVRVSWTTN